MLDHSGHPEAVGFIPGVLSVAPWGWRLLWALLYRLSLAQSAGITVSSQREFVSKCCTKILILTCMFSPFQRSQARQPAARHRWLCEDRWLWTLQRRWICVLLTDGLLFVFVFASGYKFTYNRKTAWCFYSVREPEKQVNRTLPWAQINHRWPISFSILSNICLHGYNEGCPY